MASQPALARPSPVEMLQQAFLQDIPTQSNPSPTAGSLTPRGSAPVAAKPDADSEATLSTATSQGSGLTHIPPTSSDASQSIFADLVEEQFTPPTSSSGLSSQEHTSQLPGYSPPQTNGIRAEHVEGVLPDVDNQSNGSAVHEIGSSLASPMQESFPTNLASGHKRTATGEIKGIQNGEQAGNSRAGASRHARTSSTASNGSSVTELSQQLRTRLSYAMVKVQNGWQSNTLEEIESLASQQGSPRSTASTTFGSRPTFQSPRAEMTASLRRQWSESSDETTTTKTPHSNHQNGQLPLHAGQTLASNAMTQRALAPPADIVPAASARRRPASSMKPIIAVPSTPPRLQTSAAIKQRTPSQNAAMEADAIETLLFMSSPGNSGYHPSNHPSGPQQSPLRSQFSVQSSQPLTTQRRVNFAASRGSSEEDIKAVKYTGRPRQSRHSLVRVDLDGELDDIDRMLDTMASDSEDEGRFLVGVEAR